MSISRSSMVKVLGFCVTSVIGAPSRNLYRSAPLPPVGRGWGWGVVATPHGPEWQPGSPRLRYEAFSARRYSRTEERDSPVTQAIEFAAHHKLSALPHVASRRVR